MSLTEIFAVRMPVAEIVAELLCTGSVHALRFVRRGRSASQTSCCSHIADASQDAMSGGYTTVTEGLILICTIAGWNGCSTGRLSGSRSCALRGPTCTVARPRRSAVKENLDKQNLSMDELQSQLRQQGAEDITHVRRAYLESDGKVSVVLRREK
jgi:hypothetical protein